MSRISSDLLRILSALAVMLIHSTARDERLFRIEHLFLSTEFFGVVLNQLARFCVPIFVMLSGYGLAKSYAAFTTGTPFPLRRYFASRVRKIVVPYLFISFALLIGFGRLRADDPAGSLLRLLTALLLGRADFHLYFVSIIVQCYLLFPFLIRLKHPGWLVAVLGVQILLLYPANQIYSLLNVSFPFPPSAIFVYWLFYFYIAIFYARHEKTFRPLFVKYGTELLILITVTFAGVLLEYVSHSFTASHPDYYNHFNRNLIQLYSILVFGIWIAFDSRIESRFSDKNRSRIAQIASLTFFIYLYHTVVLRFLQTTSLSAYPLLLFTVLAFLMFLIAFLLHRFLPAAPRLRVLLALPDRTGTGK